MTEQHQAFQNEWRYQWERYETMPEFLFHEWIQPRTLEDLRGKTVFEAGCGRGHHARIAARVAAQVTAMDLNPADATRRELALQPNISLVEGDIARYRPPAPFDVVYCIGVIHHTDDPDATFENLKRMVKPGGLLIVWCYSHEGNALVRRLVEPLRRWLLAKKSRRVVEALSWLLVGLMYPVVYSVYLLPLRSLPYYEYFQNFRKMTPSRNMLNVFDKLNAPQTQFITRDRIRRWFDEREFADVSITPYKGVSWRGSGIRNHD
jgi:SAM-dependent methyltransferase